MKKLQIILSAYACEPNKGSEPSVGWNWAVELIRMGHDIKIITRKNNKKVIERYIKKQSVIKKDNFYYFDLPIFFQVLKKKIPMGVYIYYYLWQFFLYEDIKKKEFLKNYDIIHHITFGTIKFPSFLWKLNKTFIFGPLGGFEFNNIKNYKDYFSFKSRIYEFIRKKINFFLFKFNKSLINCYKNTDLILSRNTETKLNLKKFFKKKIIINRDVGCFSPKKLKNKGNNIFKFLFVGRFLELKGGHILIEAFNLALKKNKKISLDFYGSGKESINWKKKIKKLRIDNYVKILGYKKFNNMTEIYSNYNSMIFPSFHDSGGTAIMEAISHSLPVICLDIGGPGEIINKKCGMKIKVNNYTNKDKLIKKLAKKINLLAADKNLYQKLSTGAFKQAKIYSWKNIVKNAYKFI